MTADTPYHWLARVVADDPDRSCLVDDATEFTYAEVLERVSVRANALREDIGAWEIVPIRVSIDIDSVIEILAIQHAGGVPLPYGGHRPSLSVSVAPDVAVCLETSGSSGRRKIVPLTFVNVASSVRSSRSRLGNDADDCWLISLPLDHVGGLSIIWRTLEAGGSAAVCPFDPSGGIIERLRPTVASMVPTMVHRLVEGNPGSLASIGSVLVGGAALALPLWERCMDEDVRLVPTYGLTEAGSQVATAASGQVKMFAGWAGSPLRDMDVVIVGLDHEPVQPGQTGLIAIEGPAVFDGYLGEEFRHRRFITNDIGRLDADNNLYVEGRIDDVIISGGENVSLGWVAGILLGLDRVDDVCVVGVEDPQWGTIGCAMVVTENSLASFDKMIESALQPHERPKRWLVRDVIPKLANGKHDLAAVRDAFEEEPWT
jgi:O-succinylbenzoic acid--CoA ligase